MKNCKPAASSFKAFHNYVTSGIGISAVVVIILLFQVCNAADTASALAVIELNMEPQVAVQIPNPVVTVSPPGTRGDIKATIDFLVEANTEQVSMFVEATDFHFTERSHVKVEPIYLNEAAGVEIDPQGARAIGHNIAAFAGDGDPIDGYPSHKTVTITYTNNSKSAQTFSHPVAVTATWNLDTIKPAGRWDAKIRLTCIAMPPR